MIEDGKIWRSRVRDYEVDFQGIVNNACYHHYLDDARVEFLCHHGIDILEYAKVGINIVLISCNIHFKYPLRWRNLFSIETALYQTERKSVVQFKQSIITEQAGNKKICASADNLVCASFKGKAIFLKELYSLAIKQ